MKKESYIRIVETDSSESGRTRIWDIFQKGDQYTRLGQIRWFGRWRAYAFFPEAGTVFEGFCMVEVSNFAWKQTYEHFGNRYCKTAIIGKSERGKDGPLQPL